MMNTDPFSVDHRPQPQPDDEASAGSGTMITQVDNEAYGFENEDLNAIFGSSKHLFDDQIPVIPVVEALRDDGLSRWLDAIRAKAILPEIGGTTPTRIWTSDARFIRLALGASGDDWQFIDHQALSDRRFDHATAEEIARQIKATKAPSLVEFRAEHPAEPIAAALRGELTGWPHQVVITILGETKKITPETRRIEVDILQSIIDGSDGISGRSTDRTPFHTQASQSRLAAGNKGALDTRNILDMLLNDQPAYQIEYEKLIEEKSSTHPSLQAGQDLAREALGEPSGLLLPVAFLLSQFEEVPYQTFRRLYDGFSRTRHRPDSPTEMNDYTITDKLGAKLRRDEKGAFVHILLTNRREGMSSMFLEGGFLSAGRLFEEIETLLCEIGIEPGFEYEAGRFFGTARIVAGDRSLANLARALERCLQATIRGRPHASQQEVAFAAQTLLSGFLGAMPEGTDNSPVVLLHHIAGELRFEQAGSEDEFDRMTSAAGAAVARVTLAYGMPPQELASSDGLWRSICLRSFIEGLADDLTEDPLRAVQFALAFLRNGHAGANQLQLVAGTLLIQAAATNYWRLALGQPSQSSQDALARRIDVSFVDLVEVLSVQSYFEPSHALIHGWLKATVPTVDDRVAALRYNVSVLDVRRARLVSRQVLSLPGLLLAGQAPKLVTATMLRWARSHGAPVTGLNISYLSTWLKQFRRGPVSEQVHHAIEPFGRVQRGLVVAALLDISGRLVGQALNIRTLANENRSVAATEAFRRAADDLSCLLQVSTELYDIARGNPELGRGGADELAKVNKGFRDRLLYLIKQAL
jgi:ribosome modulation factor